MFSKIKRATCDIVRDDGQRSLANQIFSKSITALIIVNVAMVALDLMDVFSDDVIAIFHYVEVFSVIVFTFEYILRLWTSDLLNTKITPAKARFRYITSPMALVDVAAILPFYLPFLPLPVNPVVLRMLRLLRLSRIMKLSRYSDSKTNEMILASITEAIIITDSDKNFLSANNAAYNLIPALKETKKYLPLNTVKNLPPELLDFDEEGTKESIEFNFNDEKFYKADVSKIYDKEKLLRYIIIAHDITAAIMLERAEKERIKNIFGKFVAEEVVNEMISGKVDIQLGGVVREVTVLFVDIRGFTAFSEANPPEVVVEMVNRYLNLTSHSIQEYGGMIDKYIGDATMAVFNAPNDLENHTLCAIKAAWAMKQGAQAVRDEIQRDFGVDLRFGVGIHYGNAILGNMGSDFLMDYTVIGDTVNTAARLEANSQGGQILISEAVYNRISEHIEAEDLGVIKVKNKKDGVHIYELKGVK